ncbi:hypothetical protein Tco_1442294 [Tanacetum coccineum]
MEQYLALTRGNQAPGVVKPEIEGNVNFEIKSQFMRELKEYTFSRNKNDGAHEHMERVLDIVSLFNIPRVSHGVVMLCVFPITLTGAAKRWLDRLPQGIVDSWDLLKKAFIQSLGRDMKKLKENVHAIQVGCQIFGGVHLDKDCPLMSVEEVKYGEFGRPFPNNNSNDETGREAHDKIIQGLETNVKTLANEVEGRANNGKFKECKIIFNEKQEIDNSGMTIRASRRRSIGAQNYGELKENQDKSSLLNEISQTDNYAKHMKDLVENKPRTEEDEEIRMNPRCSALLQNHLPSKEQDPGSFILHCSIGKLNFNNALADLGASINVMPISMYKRLGIGKL